VNANTLPDFPTDDQTLALLEHACDPWSHGEPEAETSSLQDFLVFMSVRGGSDPHEPSDPDQVADGIWVVELRDPQYSTNDVILALVKELRWCRGRPWQNQSVP
jgi:hypothetical protein